MAIKHATTKSPGDVLYAVADWNANHTGTEPYDSHLTNYSNPHQTTALQVGAVDLTSNQTIGGVKTFTSIPILPSSSPTSNNEAVRKKYVDDIATGLTWKKPVLDMDLSTPPENPAEGDRYRVKPPGTGAWTGYNNHLMEWSGSAWQTDGTPQSGWAVFSTDDNKGWTYDGSAWIQFSGGGAYEAGDGLDLIGTTFSIDLKSNDGLAIKDTELGVDYDNSSIGIVNNKLAVKSSGITNDMLAGNISDSKLNTITTPNKVSWVSVNKTGSKLNDIDDVNAPDPTDGQLLSWDEASSTWIPKTIEAGGGVASTTIMDVDIVSSPQTAQTWTDMPSALTELFGNTNNRIKIDLSTATKYRIVVNQSASGASGADLNLQYSTDNVTFLPADTNGAGEVDIGTGTGVKVGNWADLVAGAKADRWIRIVGKEGNGTTDPAFRQIRVQFLVPGGTGGGGVTSFNGRTGAVIPETNDYTWAQINKTTSSIADITTRSHTLLTDIGTNTHSQIDNFISSKAQANGLASLDADSKVVQNPANATATPTANKIPIADENGKLDSWITATNNDASIEFLIDGSGSAITTGVKGDLEVPFNCTINSATLLADQTGSIVIDIWKDSYTNYPPTDEDSITASTPPTITNGIKSQDTTLTGWNKTLTKGETLRFNVDSCSTITRVLLSLKVDKT